LAPGYNTDVAGFWRVAVYFNVHEVRFAQDSHGELKRSNVRLSSTLVPLSQEKNKLGGFMPDFAKITRGDLPSGYVANLRHLQDNISYYARERIVGTAMAYGEVAAFARSMKANGIKVVSKQETMGFN
jgi:hypothetical protein